MNAGLLQWSSLFGLRLWLLDRAYARLTECHDQHEERIPVEEAAFVVRGGAMESSTLIASSHTHFHTPATSGEWALSVSSLPDISHEEIVAAAQQIRHRVYRVAIAGDLSEGGYAVLADNPPHALLMLKGEPDEETFVELRELFSEEYENPYYEERRGRGSH